MVWFSDPPGDLASELPKQLESRLHSLGRHTCLLDGERLQGVLGDGESKEAHLWRVAEDARLMTEAGLIVLVTAAAPAALLAQLAEERFAPGELLNICRGTSGLVEGSTVVLDDQRASQAEQVEWLIEKLPL